MRCSPVVGVVGLSVIVVPSSVTNMTPATHSSGGTLKCQVHGDELKTPIARQKGIIENAAIATPS